MRIRISKFLCLFSSALIGLMPISITSCKNHEDDPTPPGPSPDPCDHERGPFLNEIYYLPENNVPFPAYYECLKCHKAYLDTITPEDMQVPILDLQGSLNGISKDSEKNIYIKYTTPNAVHDFEAYATIKLQGASGATLWPKKNYNIKLFSDEARQTKLDVKVNDNWKKNNKWTLKANYDDALLSHNIAGAKIFGQIAHNWNDERLEKTDNYGCVDGFPIALYNNGDFIGCYTFNLGKNKALFGMKDSETDQEGLLFANTAGDSPSFKELINSNLSNGWEIEFCSTGEDDPSQYKWMINDFNEVIQFVIDNDGQSFKNGIGNYIDMDRTLDYLVFLEFAATPDNIAKNSMWVKYKETTLWYPSAYDLDYCFGYNWSGHFYNPDIDFETSLSRNNLWSKVYANFSDEIKQHYWSLRNTVLIPENIISQFHSIYDAFPLHLLNGEQMAWPSVRFRSINNIYNFESFVKNRTNVLDKKYS